VDGIWLKRSWAGEVQNVSVLVAIGVSASGFREILGVAEGSREDSESWRQFLRYLRERGLEEIDLVISDKSLGLLEALGSFYPETKWQRCVVHFYRNVLYAVPRGKAKEVALMLKAIHAQEDKEAAAQKTAEVVKKLQALRLEKAARILESGCEATLSYYAFPVAHWRHIRTNNPLERLNREIRRRTRVVGSLPFLNEIGDAVGNDPVGEGLDAGFCLVVMSRLFQDFEAKFLLKVSTVALAEAEKTDHVPGLATDEFLNTGIGKKICCGADTARLPVSGARRCRQPCRHEGDGSRLYRGGATFCVAMLFSV
jgi:hypothetical protein